MALHPLTALGFEVIAPQSLATLGFTPSTVTLTAREPRVPPQTQETARTLNNAAVERWNSRNGAQRNIVKGAVVKGSRVRLADGTVAKVLYVDPNMRIARVRTEAGKNLTVRRKDLR